MEKEESNIIGRYEISDAIYDLYKDKDGYFLKNTKTGERKEIDIKELISGIKNYWDYPRISYNKEKHRAEFWSPIYDFIHLTIFGTQDLLKLDGSDKHDEYNGLLSDLFINIIDILTYEMKEEDNEK